MRRYVSPTPEFEQAVTEYQKRHGYKSWSIALLELARRGLLWQTGNAPAVSSKQWGGKRNNKAQGDK